jgi:hypothetical protein
MVTYKISIFTKEESNKKQKIILAEHDLFLQVSQWFCFSSFYTFPALMKIVLEVTSLWKCSGRNKR